MTFRLGHTGSLCGTFGPEGFVLHKFPKWSEQVCQECEKRPVASRIMCRVAEKCTIFPDNAHENSRYLRVSAHFLLMTKFVVGSVWPQADKNTWECPGACQRRIISIRVSSYRIPYVLRTTYIHAEKRKQCLERLFWYHSRIKGQNWNSSLNNASRLPATLRPCRAKGKSIYCWLLLLSGYCCILKTKM